MRSTSGRRTQDERSDHDVGGVAAGLVGAAVRRAARRRHDRGDPDAARPTTARRCSHLHEHVSEDTLRLRFFTANRNAGRQYVARLFDPDHTEQFALVALVRGRLAGLATAEVLSEDRAEVAFLVSDQDRGRGLGSLLLEHLAALGREHGLTRFDADVLADNYGMLRVFRGAGFSVARRTEHGEVSVELRTDVSAAALDASDRREWRSEARSLRPLLAPESVAVVGVRRSAGGHRPRRARLHPSRAATPGGCRSCTRRPTARAARSPGCRRTRTCRPCPGRVDLVMVVVPPDEVGEVIADACAAGVGAAVVVSSGFSGSWPRRRPGPASSSPGPTASGWSARTPRACSATRGASPLNASFARVLPDRGGLAVASQSGGVGFTLLDLASDLGVGVHSFVSLGAKLDVSSNDLLAAWGDDDSVSVGGAVPRVVRQRLEVRPHRAPLRRAQAAARRRRRRPRGPRRRRHRPRCSPRRG